MTRQHRTYSWTPAEAPFRGLPPITIAGTGADKPFPSPDTSIDVAVDTGTMSAKTMTVTVLVDGTQAEEKFMIAEKQETMQFQKEAA